MLQKQNKFRKCETINVMLVYVDLFISTCNNNEMSVIRGLRRYNVCLNISINHPISDRFKFIIFKL